jgi:ParB-like chromosome segregation protein Spo0J
VPILIDAELRVIAGHGRLLACRLLGRSEVPTIHYENTRDIDEILETHVKNGGRVTRLMLQPGQKAPG